MVSKSKKLFDQAKKIIPSGVNSPVRFFKPYPFFVKKHRVVQSGTRMEGDTSITAMDTVLYCLDMQERRLSRQFLRS